jgi:hypothetical protein
MEDVMRSFCQRCGKPRHLVGGRALARSENRLAGDGVTIVETVRQMVEGKCEECGTTLWRLTPGVRRQSDAAEVGAR